MKSRVLFGIAAGFCMAVTLAGAAPERGIPLADAVAAFNKAAAADPIGAAQPPLTEDEVVARILDWNARLNPAPASLRDIYRQVVEDRRLPDGLHLNSSTGSYNGDYFITVWRVTLDLDSMPSGSMNHKLGVGFSYPIRTRHIQARPLTDEEQQTMAAMLEQAETARRELGGRKAQPQ